jgi:hypothetical protein
MNTHVCLLPERDLATIAYHCHTEFHMYVLLQVLPYENACILTTILLSIYEDMHHIIN